MIYRTDDSRINSNILYINLQETPSRNSANKVLYI